jgi:hypothetical protein
VSAAPKPNPSEASGNAALSKEIGKEEAIAIANKAALEMHKSLKDLNVVACEQSVFWAVVYDGDNSEYLIDKASGEIIQVRRVPQGLANRTNEEAGPPEKIQGISEDAAIAIATNGFRTTYGQEADKNIVILPCELAKVWRIVFDVKLHRASEQSTPVIPVGHAPTYVVDKRTGEVLYKQLY